MLKMLLMLALPLCIILTSCATVHRSDAKDNCRRYIVAPPHNTDEKAADTIRKAWIAAVKDELGSCDTFVPKTEANEALVLVDLTHREALKPGDLNRSQMSFLKERTKATHLVWLRYEVKGRELVIQPTIIGRLPRHEQASSRFDKRQTIILPASNAISYAVKNRWFVRSFSIIPNAGEIGFTNSELSNARAGEDEESELYTESVHKRSVLPSILSSIRITSIRPPYRFAPFDWDWDWFLGFDFANYDNSYVYRRRSTADQPNQDPERIEYAIQLWSIAPTISIELSGHTPLGTTFFTVGSGLSIYTYRDSFGGKTGASILIIAGFGHRAFITDRVYFSFAANSITSNPPMVKNDVFLERQRDYFIFGIGYFAPELRSRLRRSL